MVAVSDSATENLTGVAGGAIEISGVSIGFGALDVVKDIDLSVRPGEFICLLGPSGCGKSTQLASIAGFVPLRGGQVTCCDEPVRGPNRQAGMVFQSTDALFDWLTVEQNVAYGPRMSGMSKAEQKQVATANLEMVGLRHAAQKYPHELSGGMKQRVQIARVLANHRPVILMDEPFGALDAQTRQVLQEELGKIWRRTGCTVVFVTHDIDEAITLADRVVVMSAGPRARIKSVYDVDLPRPRARTHPGVSELYELLREDIRAEVLASMQAQGIEEEL